MLRDGVLQRSDKIFVNSGYISLSDWISYYAEADDSKSSIGKDGKPLVMRDEMFAQRAPKPTDRPRPEKKKRRKRKFLGERSSSSHDNVIQSHANYKERRKQLNFLRTISGWVAAAAIFAVTVLCIAGGYSFKKQADESQVRVTSLEKRVTMLSKLARSLVQPVPPGYVLGVLGIEDAEGNFFALAGVEVTLYKRDDVEKFIAQHPPSDKQPITTEAEVTEFLKTFKSAMSKPVVAAPTAADGTFAFSVPYPEDYVLFVNANEVLNGPHMIWLYGVRLTDLPSRKILLTNRDASTVAGFSFTISE